MALTAASLGHGQALAQDPLAPSALGDVRSLLVDPQRIELHATSLVQQLLVTAERADGRLADVTRGSVLLTGDPGVARVEGTTIAAVDAGELVRTGRAPGEAISVNYLGRLGVVRVQVPRPDRSARFPELPLENEVGVLVRAKLAKMGSSPRASATRRPS
jgi:hypothetical protein